jgi:hypothetical protein
MNNIIEKEACPDNTGLFYLVPSQDMVLRLVDESWLREQLENAQIDKSKKYSYVAGTRYAVACAREAILEDILRHTVTTLDIVSKAYEAGYDRAYNEVVAKEAGLLPNKPDLEQYIKDNNYA